MPPQPGMAHLNTVFTSKRDFAISMRNFEGLRHGVEFGPKSVQLSERVPENFNAPEWKSPLKKGDKVLVEIVAMELFSDFRPVAGCTQRACAR